MVITEQEWRDRFAEVLKEKMQENDFTQGDLAKRLGVSQEAVSFWIRKKCTISGWNLIKVCVVFGLNFWEIVPVQLYEWALALDKKA